MPRFFFALAIILALLPQQLQAKWHHHTFNIMGTKAHVEFWLPKSSAKQQNAQQLIDAVVAEMERLDNALSPYIETSELSAVNRKAAYSRTQVSPELFHLLSESIEIAKISKGAFDITFASIGFQYDYRRNIKPDQPSIDKALSAINYQAITLRPETLEVSLKNKAVKIDLGGIAKGYAIKRCIALLKNAGIEHALMSAGGDTALLGDRNGRPWLVGIKHPRAAQKNVVHIPLSDEVISTSGDYERYFIEDGVRYHHIINPKTGDSAREVVSVSVIGNDATVVDALSTTVFVQGLSEGMALINSLKGYEAIIIDNEQRLHYSQGLQQ